MEKVITKNSIAIAISLVQDIANGLSIKEIAADRRKTVASIERRLTAQRVRYGAHSLAELVALMMRKGLIK